MDAGHREGDRQGARRPVVLTTAIQFDRVTLALGGRTVLEDISLAVNEGEFVGVLGANGSGKTTLIRALLGLLRPASGTISVLGHPATRGNSAVGYLPQVRSAVPPVALSGYDFLAASLAGHRWGLPVLTAPARREIDQALGTVQAQDLARRPLSDMSGGERQRLLIAQALVGQPRLLLLDEPLIGLDPYQQEVIVDLVRTLSRDLGLTVLFTAHELNQLLRAIDRVLYLGNGQAAMGTVNEVIRPEVLSRLYGAPIQVVRADGHIFVMSHGQDIERDHSHDPDRPHDHGGHPHVGDGHHHA
jgi:zinc/manganese transport system ATP-binding protein